jgi:hypothetical protein
LVSEELIVDIGVKRIYISGEKGISVSDSVKKSPVSDHDGRQGFGSPSYSKYLRSAQAIESSGMGDFTLIKGNSGR